MGVDWRHRTEWGDRKSDEPEKLTARSVLLHIFAVAMVVIAAYFVFLGLSCALSQHEAHDAGVNLEDAGRI
jgi:hypothetical protein